MRRSAACLLLLCAAPAAASTFIRTSVEEVTRGSDAVVRGVVVSSEARMTADRRIVTDVEVAVASAWKGAPEEIVRIVVPGGSLGWIALAVDAAPSFDVGEEVVVFLVRKGPAWSVAGWALGKYRVDGEEAHPGVGQARLVARPLAVGERAVGAMSVAELERRVRAAR